MSPERVVKSGGRVITAVALLATTSPEARAAEPRPRDPSLTVCGKAHRGPVRSALRVLVETFEPGSGTPANPIKRFADIRVGYSIELSTLPHDRRGEDGGLEPALALFEPMRPDGKHYHLPWTIPAGTRLVEDERWGGWDAWLGNDNDAIVDNVLMFLEVDAKGARIRWTGRVAAGTDCRFEFEGRVPFESVILGAIASRDTAKDLDLVFGAANRGAYDVRKEEFVEKWTKERRQRLTLVPR